MPATSSSKNTSSSSRGKRPRATATGSMSSSSRGKRPRATATGATSSSKSPRAKAHGATSSSSRGQNLKITKNEVEAVKASLLEKGTYGVLNLDHFVRTKFQGGKILRHHPTGNSDFLPTINLSQLITQASHIIRKTRPLPGLGRFEGQFFFPIVLHMTTKKVNVPGMHTRPGVLLFETNLIASTGIEMPHDTGATSIHNFHRLLNTAYPAKYKNAMKTLDKIITNASKDLNWWKSPTIVVPSANPSANLPHLPISISFAFEAQPMRSSAMLIEAQLRVYGMHLFMVDMGTNTHGYNTITYFAGHMVKW